MKERPILFSAPMVEAILAGTKTMTRRIVKPPPPELTDGSARMYQHGDGWRYDGCNYKGDDHERCPYGAPGDLLWVRETWARVGHPERTVFRAERADDYQWSAAPGFRWSPSIHMRRGLSRIDLEVTAVRVERLHDITEEDARAEGVQPGSLSVFDSFYIGAFADLWESINGERASWHSNPWVWVVAYKLLRGGQ